MFQCGEMFSCHAVVALGILLALCTNAEEILAYGGDAHHFIHVSTDAKARFPGDDEKSDDINQEMFCFIC